MGIFDFIKKNKKGSGPALPEDTFDASVLELQDIIAPSALKVGSKDINLSGTKVRTHCIAAVPLIPQRGMVNILIINLEICS